MIEIVSAAACIACDVCVKVCPTDVFDRGADGVDDEGFSHGRLRRFKQMFADYMGA